MRADSTSDKKKMRSGIQGILHEYISQTTALMQQQVNAVADTVGHKAVQTAVAVVQKERVQQRPRYWKLRQESTSVLEDNNLGVVVICNLLDLISEVVHPFHSKRVSAVLFAIFRAILLIIAGVKFPIVDVDAINDSMVDNMVAMNSTLKQCIPKIWALILILLKRLPGA